jgi:uncharacterized YigZ family protein
MTEYRTVRAAASGEFTEKRSRFIGYIKPVATQDEATDFINGIKAKHWDATHNVYAYVLRDGQTRRYSDDGEPQGTAGVPVLDVLLKENVTDCAVVVTRYFGGVLLGTGGLVRAYSHAAKLALSAGGIVAMRPCDVLKLSADYAIYGRLSSLISGCEGFIDDTEFADGVTLTFRLPCSRTNEFEKKLADVSLGKLKCEYSGVVYSQFDLNQEI